MAKIFTRPSFYLFLAAAICITALFIFTGKQEPSLPEPMPSDDVTAERVYERLLSSFEQDGFIPDYYAGAYIEDGMLMVLTTEWTLDVISDLGGRCADEKITFFSEAGYSYNYLKSLETFTEKLTADNFNVIEHGVDERENAYVITLDEESYRRFEASGESYTEPVIIKSK